MKKRKLYLLIPTILLILLLSILLLRPHAPTVPSRISNFYTSFLAAFSTGTYSDIDPYLHYEYPIYRELNESNFHNITSCKIESWSKLSDQLWEVTTLIQLEGETEWRECYHFLGEVGGEMKVMISPDNVPNDLAEELDLSRFVSEDTLPLDPESQKLLLQYETGGTPPFLTVKPDTLNGHYEGSLFFVALQNVTIQLNGKDVLLETAIREGDISVEEIVAYARVDARNGFCTEKEHTENGLSQFTYDYGNYRVNTIDDVYETPDGQAHRIKTFAVMAPTVVENEGYGFFYEGNGDIDREEWGVQLEVTDCTPNGVEIKSEQSGGQQLGTLSVVRYYLTSQEDRDFYYEDTSLLAIPLTMGGTTTFHLDWSNENGPLSTGHYYLVIVLQDNYPEDMLTPMIRKFHDRQSYMVEFTIDTAP